MAQLRKLLTIHVLLASVDERTKTVLTFFHVLEKWGGETHFRKPELERKA